MPPMPRTTTLLSLLVLVLADARKAPCKLPQASAQLRDNQTSAPQPPLGVNANATLLQALCPRRNFARCFATSLQQKYPYVPLWRQRRPGVSWSTPLPNTLTMLPHCHRTNATDAPTTSSFSFAGSALDPDAPSIIPGTNASAAADLRSQLGAARRRAASHGSPPARVLRCDSAAASLDAALLIIVGVPTGSSHRDALRRGGARATWLSAPQVGRTVVACFLLSTEVARKADLAERVVDEAVASGDLVLLQAPESRYSKTKYSGFQKAGRGMPTFKQFAFFRHVAAHLKRVPYVGKIDDDTAVNLRVLHPMLQQLRCFRHALIGSIQWSAFIPRAELSGIRGDRCAFGWEMYGALRDYAKPFGANGTRTFRPSCDAQGAVLPLPYAAGAGYILSGALLRWLGTDTAINGWVADAAAGRDRERYQWQKYEDTTTGYWLTYSPSRVTYVNIGFWQHDLVCDSRTEERGLANKGGYLRPPANYSLLVHNLKFGGFEYAYERMANPMPKYDHQRCERSRNKWRRADLDRPIVRRSNARGSARGARGGARGARGGRTSGGRARGRGR